MAIITIPQESEGMQFEVVREHDSTMLESVNSIEIITFKSQTMLFEGRPHKIMMVRSVTHEVINE